MIQSKNNLPGLPQGWTWAKLEEIGTIVTGNTPPKKNAQNYDKYIPFVKPPQLDRGIIMQAKDFLSEEGVQLGRVLPPYSVLVSCIGILGKTGLNKVPVAFNQQINAIVPHNLISPKYCLYYCQTLRDWLYSVASATTLSIVNKAKFSAAPICIAPQAEQHRIVAKLEELFSRLDAGVDALQKIKLALKRYRQSVLKHACEGKLTAKWREENKDRIEPISKMLETTTEKRKERFKDKGRALQPFDTSNSPELPEEWGWIRLGEVADIKGGIAKNQKREFINGRTVPYLRVANVQRGYLDLSQVKTIEASEEIIADLSLEHGDVLFTEGGDRDKLGRGCIWRGEIGECIHQNHIFRARLLSQNVSNKLISWYGNTFGQVYFMREGKQTTNLASINMTKLRSFPIPIIPKQEQEVLVAEIERRFSITDEVEHVLKQAMVQSKGLRQTILKRAFEGKLVPQDPNDEPASVLLERIQAEKAQAEQIKPKKSSKEKKPCR